MKTHLVSCWCVEVVYLEEPPNCKPRQRSIVYVFDSRQEAQAYLYSPSVKQLVRHRPGNKSEMWEM